MNHWQFISQLEARRTRLFANAEALERFLQDISNTSAAPTNPDVFFFALHGARAYLDSLMADRAIYHHESAPNSFGVLPANLVRLLLPTEKASTFPDYDLRVGKLLKLGVNYNLAVGTCFCDPTDVELVHNAEARVSFGTTEWYDVSSQNRPLLERCVRSKESCLDCNE